MAIRSTLRSRESRINSVAGSPMASSIDVTIDCAASSDARFSRYWRSPRISSDSRRPRSLKWRAAKPSATWTSSSSAPVSTASERTWARMVRSAGEFSTATRIRLYMGHCENGLGQQPDVQGRNDNCHAPGKRTHPTGCGELTHLVTVGGEAYEGKHGERQLQAQDDLAEDQQGAVTLFAVQSDDDYRGNDGDEAGDQPPQP